MEEAKLSGEQERQQIEQLGAQLSAASAELESERQQHAAAQAEWEAKLEEAERSVEILQTQLEEAELSEEEREQIDKLAAELGASSEELHAERQRHAVAQAEWQAKLQEAEQTIQGLQGQLAEARQSDESER